MQITLDIDEATLAPAIKNHLENGQTVQSYIEQGCRLLTYLRSCDKSMVLLTGTKVETRYNEEKYRNLAELDISRFLQI